MESNQDSKKCTIKSMLLFLLRESKSVPKIWKAGRSAVKKKI
jgi:hypothetical protein